MSNQFSKLQIIKVIFFFLFPFLTAQAQTLHTEQKKPSSGIVYTILYPENLKADLETVRPQKNDPAVQICVPAAYTDLDSFKPLGLLVHKGVLHSKTGYLPGTLQIVNGSIEIMRIDRGHHPGDSLLNATVAQQGTLLQQEILVIEGKNQRTEGGSFFQRRALVQLGNGRVAVIESDRDITMFRFAADLIELGAVNAFYLDMGNWDEGWYKTGNKAVTIGKRRKATHRQSNWLVFK